jgi:hypothetical protein
MPLALDDESLSAVLAAAETVPHDRRNDFLERTTTELAALPVIGPGVAHRIAYRIARELGMESPNARRWTRMPSKSRLLLNGK